MRDCKACKDENDFGNEPGDVFQDVRSQKEGRRAVSNHNCGGRLMCATFSPSPRRPLSQQNASITQFDKTAHRMRAECNARWRTRVDRGSRSTLGVLVQMRFAIELQCTARHDTTLDGRGAPGALAASRRSLASRLGAVSAPSP